IINFFVATMCFLIKACQNQIKRNPARFVAIVHPLSVLFVIGSMVFFFAAEMFYVVPRLFGIGSGMYKFIWILAVFITYNVLSNLLAVYRTDTSVASLPKERQMPKPGEEHLWHFCKSCQTLVPPRSWHCKLCKGCILKRDHHCIFTAACIGYRNHRYFFWYTFYLTLGAALSLGFNYVYMVMIATKNLSNSNLSFEGLNLWLIILVCLNTYAFVAPFIMLTWQTYITLSNTTFFSFYELRYDLGALKNLKFVLGRRWFWTFLSPSIESPLSGDGTQWQLKQQC
ncbi:hypothetical protein KR009_000071, partial [Drosophila setifemur]